MSEATTLSDEALTLLRRRFAREHVEVDDLTRPLYRELVAAGLLMPLHSFSRGNEGAYRLTEAACDMMAGINGLSIRVPSA